MPQERVGAEFFSPDIIDFLRLAQKHRVELLIVGGIAVALHGAPRFTGDIDFFYCSSPPNAARLFGCLQEFWQGAIPGIVSEAELAEPRVVIQFGRPPNRLDLINDIDGVTFGEAWESAETIEIASEPPVQTKVISRALLVRNKQASGRAKDLGDVEALIGRLDGEHSGCRTHAEPRGRGGGL